MRSVNPIPIRTQPPARRCLKCGDPNLTTDPYCRRCTLNRIAMRVMRDPGWPDADERRILNAREAAIS